MKVSRIILLLMVLSCVAMPALCEKMQIATIDNKYVLDAEIYSRKFASTSTWTKDARHYGINWRKLNNVFTPEKDDIVYIDSRWLGVAIAKVFYEWGEKNRNIRISEDAVYMEDKLYGRRIDDKTITEKSVDVRYIEIAGEIDMEKAKLLIEMYPCIELINMRYRIDPSVAAYMCNSLPIKYVHWGFIDSIISPIDNMDVAYDRISRMQPAIDMWFYVFYDELKNYKMTLVDLAGVSDWIANMYWKICDAKGIIISSNILPRNVKKLWSVAKEVRGFICRIENEIELNMYRENPESIKYFSAKIKRIIPGEWPHLVALTINHKSMSKINPSESIRDLYLTDRIYDSDSSSNKKWMRSCKRIKRVHYRGLIDDIVDCSSESLSHIESHINLTNNNIQWFCEHIESIGYGSIAIDDSLDVEKVKKGVLREVCISSFIGNKMSFWEFLRRVKHNDGFLKICVYNEYISYSEREHRKIVDEIDCDIFLYGVCSNDRLDLANSRIKSMETSGSFRFDMFTEDSWNIDDLYEAIMTIKRISRVAIDV